MTSIYKKRNPLDAANYSPISLLCSINKLYAGMLQTRIANAIDDDISNVQFGFRTGRSTSNPSACVRRLLDRAEASTNPMCFTFLDWGKAFDRIKQDKLLEALERLDIPSKMLEAIKSFYKTHYICF